MSPFCDPMTFKSLSLDTSWCESIDRHAISEINKDIVDRLDWSNSQPLLPVNFVLGMSRRACLRKPPGQRRD